MSVIIENMDMPKCCEECQFSIWSKLNQTAGCTLVKDMPMFVPYSLMYLDIRSVYCPLKPYREEGGDK